MVVNSGGKITTPKSRTAVTGVVLPLALAQFIASFAASNMNVAINSVATDLNTTVIGVQTAITIFTLVMAALMIPGSKLTDIWGRKLCLILGLSIYGLGALIASLAPHLGTLVFGYSILEGIGSALMIPPIYIMITVFFTDTTSRAKNFGIISAAAGIGSAAGPLIGGLVTSLISWRASFLLQVLVVGTIILLSRKIVDSPLPKDRPSFDIGGAILSAAGMVLIVIGTLISSTYGWFRSRQDFSLFGKVLIHEGGISPVWLFIGIGILAILWFYRYIQAREESGKTPLLSTRLFHNAVSNFGLITQNMQWLILQGSFFVVSVFLQTVRGYSAIQTGLALTPATAGILLSSAAAPRLARNHPQTTLVRWGFMITMLGMILLLLFARAHSSIIAYFPGLFAMGLGVGIMLTSSVNIVQSSFPEKDQGEISGLSRSVSNLGSSFGTALAGSILVSTLVEGNKHFVLALFVMLVASSVGLFAAFKLPVVTQKTG